MLVVMQCAEGFICKVWCKDRKEIDDPEESDYFDLLLGETLVGLITEEVDNPPGGDSSSSLKVRSTVSCIPVYPIKDTLFDLAQ